jgi:NitT/TauT family transport system permease protein
MKNILGAIYKFLQKGGLLTWIILIGIWSIGSLLITKSFLPSPWETIIGGKELVLNGKLFYFMLVSIGRVLKGWTISLCFAVPIGLLIGRSETVKKLFEPFIDFFRFVPAIALITLFLMWFGVGEKSKTALIIYASFFVIVVNTAAGVLGVEQNRIQAARALGASELQILLTVIIPSAVPFIFTGLRLGLGSSFTAIVGAEMIAANEGLGYLIYTSRLYFKTDWIFVGVLTLGTLGFLSDKGLRLFGKKVLGRYGVKDGSRFGDAERSKSK